MSKEVDRASVFRATKVRTKLKGDASWMQRCSEPQSEAEEEKPWMAEVRVNRPNGAPIDTSPMSSPTSKTPPSPRPAEERAPSPGYLIRGVFTKTDTKPAATSSTSNSFRVPHTVRPTTNLPVQTEDQLSPEEKEKREEAAMDVLRSSSVQQRSYVLSAAKKYDSADKPPETSPTPDVPSFVAKRVVITDNDDSVFTETPSVPKETAAPSVKGVSPVSGKYVSPVCVKDVSPVSVKDVSPVSVKAVSPVCVKDISPVSVKAVSPVCVKDVPTVCVKDVLLPAPVIVDTPAVKPGCTKMATPLPELTVEVMKKLSPESGVPLKDVPPVSPVLVSPVPYNSVKTDPAPVDTLTALSDTLISFDTGSSSLEEELVEPIPPSPGFWSQELLSGSDRYSVSTEVVSPDSPTPSTDSSVNENMLEALADDVIPIDTNTNTTRLTWKRSWDVNPITTTDKSEDEEDEEDEEQEDPQVSLVTVQKQSSESDSPWDRWSAPTVYKEKETEKRDPEPSMDRSNSYSSTLDSSANQRPKSPDTESKKGFVYLKEYVNATDLTKHNTRDDPDYVTSSSSSHFYSSPSSSTRSTMTSACTYCGEQVGNDAKITIEHLNISCHPACFKCGVCSKPMGDFLFNMFLHKGTVHCESCYSNVF